MICYLHFELKKIRDLLKDVYPTCNRQRQEKGFIWGHWASNNLFAETALVKVLRL